MNKTLKSETHLPSGAYEWHTPAAIVEPIQFGEFPKRFGATSLRLLDVLAHISYFPFSPRIRIFSKVVTTIRYIFLFSQFIIRDLESFFYLQFICYIMIDDEIQITQTLSESQKDGILEIIYNAFEKKISNLELKPKSKEQGMRIIKKSANFEQGLYGLYKSQIIGGVGMNFREKRFYYFQWELLKKEFGFFGALWRSIVQKFSVDNLKDNELYIGSIAVAEDYRGKGFGTQLLNTVNDFAKKNGFETIILDVVDTNPRAYELYKRFGFKVIKKRKFGFITRSAGFSFTYKMKYLV